MKRNRLHLTFGLVAAACGLIVVYQVSRLHQAQLVNAAIASAGSAALDSSVPEARFARAIALSKAGDYETALKTYKVLAQSEREDIKRAALYNLGNLHLRQALKNGAENAVQSLPLIELAKQSYRDLLRIAPQDWDARYNLERALWLAPEVADEIAQDDGPPIEKERALTTMQGPDVELP